MHLDQACVDVMRFCSSGEQVPINTLKQLEETCVLMRKEISQYKTITLKEDFQNRIMFEDLAVVMRPHGFDIGIERFTLPVTEFGRSRNNHCLIHRKGITR